MNSRGKNSEWVTFLGDGQGASAGVKPQPRAAGGGWSWPRKRRKRWYFGQQGNYSMSFFHYLTSVGCTVICTKKVQ